MPYVPEKSGLNATATMRRLFPILLFFLALLPRTVALNRYITPDELIWMYRSVEFREALVDHRWADTLVAGHPGVTTTWLGASAISVQIALSGEARETYEWLTTMAYLTPDNTAAFERLFVFLSGARLAVAVVNALGLVAIYWLATRYWGPLVAILLSLLLALDPFFAGLSGLLHVDALSTTFATLSLLLLLPAVSKPAAAQGRGSAGWLVLSGIAGGVAAWTKTPAGVIAAVAALAILVATMTDRSRPLPSRFARMAGWGAAWAIPFLVTGIVLLPALWSAPLTVYDTLTGNASRHLEEALRPTFFLGETGFVHGPLFYPVSLLWRLSPVVVLALLPATLLAWRGWRSAQTNDSRRVTVWPLLIWILLFTLVVTLAAKKFDRYILPVIPAIVILAALAWGFWLQRGHGGRWLLPALVLGQVTYLAFFWTAPLSAYNPLVGGPWTAESVLPIGWGEGISFSGTWLSTNQPDILMERAMGGVTPSLAPFFAGETLVEGFDDPGAADYIILTAGGRQLNPAGFAETAAALEHLRTVRYGGLEQAWIFRQPNPQPDPRAALPLESPVQFGSEFALTDSHVLVSDDAAVIAVRWRRLQPLPAEARYRLAMDVTDESGNHWAGLEADLLNNVAFYPPDWTNDDSDEVRYVLDLPPAMPPGTYEVTLTVVDQISGGRLPVQTITEGFAGVRHTLGTIAVEPPEQPVTTPRLQIPVAGEQRWFEDALRILGQSELPPAQLAGSEFTVDLFWHAESTLPASLQLEWLLSEPDGMPVLLAATPLSRFDTGEWRAGESIQEKYRLSLPADLRPEQYDLSVRPVERSGDAGDSYFVGQVQIDNIERVYTLPSELGQAIDLLFGDLFWLRGIRLPGEPVVAGQSLPLTLVWQADAEPQAVYNVFVHVLDDGGQIVAQSDHWPGGLPTEIWAADQVIIDALEIELPPSLPGGVYSLGIGLYNPLTGDRLRFTDQAGKLTDQLVLPDALEIESP